MNRKRVRACDLKSLDGSVIGGERKKREDNKKQAESSCVSQV